MESQNEAGRMQEGAALSRRCLLGWLTRARPARGAPLLDSGQRSSVIKRLKSVNGVLYSAPLVQ
jgi:hypothetical protein